MNTRELGSTRVRVSEVSLGTWAFASGVYGQVSEEQADATIREAIDRGITLFDTAPLYGEGKRDGVAEKVLGRLLGADRDRVHISTKFGRNPSDDCRPAFHGQRARSSVEESLRRLRTDRIDLLFFHSPFSPDEIHDDVWEALGALKDQGKIRFVGHSVSAFGATEQMCRTWASERKIDVIQVVYSLLNREAWPLIRDLSQDGIGVVARECLANGFLSGSVKRDTVFPPGTLNARYSRDEVEARGDQVDRLSYLVRGGIETMPQAALRWVLDHPEISTVLTGAKSPAELHDAVIASAAPSYTRAELDRAAQLHTTDFAAA